MNRKRILIVFATLAMLVCVAMSVCANGSDKQEEQNVLERNHKVLVAYFSWSGNTKAVGQYIAQKTKADVFEVERAKPYPDKYELCVKEAHAETGKRPALKGDIKNISDYDVIFIGTPVWSGSIPMPMFTFLEGHDFKGKTVIPFCTCYTSEGNSLNDIIKATVQSKHLDGISIATRELGGKDIDKQYGNVDKWLKGIGLIQ